MRKVVVAVIGLLMLASCTNDEVLQLRQQLEEAKKGAVPAQLAPSESVATPASAIAATPEPTAAPPHLAKMTVSVVGPDRSPIALASVSIRCASAGCTYSSKKAAELPGVTFDDLPPGQMVQISVQKDGWLFTSPGLFFTGKDTYVTVKGAPLVAEPSPTPVPTPTPTPTPEPQQTINQSGTGRIGLVGPFTLQTGARKFTATHSGSSNFVVWLKDSKGASVDLIFNEIGSYSGSYTSFVKTSGSYYLDVDANGAWTVKVE